MMVVILGGVYWFLGVVDGWSSVLLIKNWWDECSVLGRIRHGG